MFQPAAGDKNVGLDQEIHGSKKFQNFFKKPENFFLALNHTNLLNLLLAQLNHQ